MSDRPVFPFRYASSQQVSMPLGGLGAGCIGLNGGGGLVDFFIAHRPATTALPDGHETTLGAFALLRVSRDRETAAKLLEGPLPATKIYSQGLQAQGYHHGAFEGLPRFEKIRFSAGYPFGNVYLSQPDVQLRAAIVGWSPFVPLDDVASSVPCAILEYTFTNPTRRSVDFEFSFHLSHPAVGEGGWPLTCNEVIPGRGVHFTSEEPAESDAFGSASLTLVGQQPAVKAMWLRGGWFDAVSALWREAETGTFQPNDGREDAGSDGRNDGSVLVWRSFKPSETITIPVATTWHFPNSSQNYGGEPVTGETNCSGGPVTWHPFYASKWRDALRLPRLSTNVSILCADGPSLFRTHCCVPRCRGKCSMRFQPNLAILKSPTILREKTATSGVGRGISPVPVAVRAVAPTSGTTPRHCPIFSLRSNAPCVNKNTSARPMSRDTATSAPRYRTATSCTISTQRPTGNLAAN